MAPKRSNKGKEKMEYDGKGLFKIPRLSSISEKVIFSKKIQVLVHPSGDEDNFVSLFKVSRKTFNYIRSLVRVQMTSQDTYFTFSDDKEMSLNDQIALSLKRLSSVDSSINLATLFETSKETVDDVTWHFVEALEAHGAHHISWPSDITETKVWFESIGSMPNCCGAIDMTHINMYSCKNESEADVWRDNMNNSMMLQVIVDPTMRFIDVVSRYPGHTTKEEILRESKIFELARDEEMLNGNVAELPDGTKIREYLVGDSSYPLLPWLITPYHDVDEELTNDQTEFNKRHLATRRVACCALKKLKEVWAVNEGGMWQPERYKLQKIISACCILHNINIDTEGDAIANEFMTSCDHDPGYPPEKSTLPEDGNASVVRDKLCLYMKGKVLDEASCSR
ncbi:hypothetical protein QVD17_17592 [Tagetes erecta]|uniref:DDE Tnp4 domain-containing protein n=1 Tax=Tagetes erecta TaxID=13708 RepID=A0AAD8KTC1_TARER|nr:hypothetical protein QVD17_17592 [Tagetes erecta]